MAKNEKLNEEAAMNNNVGSSTYQMNRDIAKRHEKPTNDSFNKNKK